MRRARNEKNKQGNKKCVVCCECDNVFLAQAVEDKRYHDCYQGIFQEHNTKQRNQVKIQPFQANFKQDLKIFKESYYTGSLLPLSRKSKLM